MPSYLTYFHITPNGLDVWILNCSTELMNLIRAIPYPLAFSKGIPQTSFLNFGYAINSETQLAVIRHYSSDNSLSVRVRDHYTRWNTVASARKAVVRWRTTDSIKHWRRLEQLDRSYYVLLSLSSLTYPPGGLKCHLCSSAYPGSCGPGYCRGHASGKGFTVLHIPCGT